jgi:hypothetical protein
MTGNPDDVSIDYVATYRGIPTLTGWGMLVLALLLVAAGIAVVRRRRLTSAR